MNIKNSQNIWRYVGLSHQEIYLNFSRSIIESPSSNRFNSSTIMFPLSIDDRLNLHTNWFKIALLAILPQEKSHVETPFTNIHDFIFQVLISLNGINAIKRDSFESNLKFSTIDIVIRFLFFKFQPYLIETNMWNEYLYGLLKWRIQTVFIKIDKVLNKMSFFDLIYL